MTPKELDNLQSGQSERMTDPGICFRINLSQDVIGRWQIPRS